MSLVWGRLEDYGLVVEHMVDTQVDLGSIPDIVG